MKIRVNNGSQKRGGNETKPKSQESRPGRGYTPWNPNTCPLSNVQNLGLNGLGNVYSSGYGPQFGMASLFHTGHFAAFQQYREVVLQPAARGLARGYEVFPLLGYFVGLLSCRGKEIGWLRLPH